MIGISLSQSEQRALIDSWQPVNRKGEALAFFMLQQVMERFRTQGASGGTPWQPKKFADGRSVLTGRSARMKDSFQTYATATTCSVFSDLFYTKIHQFGKTIRAKNAKALFIPLTDRAAASQREAGPKAARIRWVYGMPRIGEGPLRVADRGKKLTLNVALTRKLVAANLPLQMFAPLIKGRFHNGKLQKWDAKKLEWVDGQPDFIFLKKVVIPARPMLPDGPAEQAAQLDFIADLYHPHAKV